VSPVAGRRAAMLSLWALAFVRIAHASDADPQLHDAADRVLQAWRASGANAFLLKARFLNTERTEIALPQLPDSPCKTLAFLGPRGLSFRVSIADADEGGAPERIASEAGVAETARCGQPPWLWAAVLTESGRGALEVVVAGSEVPLTPVRTILPERTEGYVGPEPEPGRLAALPSPERRATSEEARAREDGAEIDHRFAWTANPDGRGSASVTLDAGCHALTLFAPEASSHEGRGNNRLDVDAEMRDASDDHLMSRDQTDAPDARVGACVGEETVVTINYVGATPGTRVVVTHELRRLPKHLPTVWGNEIRARMAQTLFVRHVYSLPTEASTLAQGGSGTLALPLTLEPGACYLALAVLSEPATEGIGMSVRVGARESADVRTADDVGSTVAFCAGTHLKGQLEIDARGAPLFGWALAIYRLQNGIWDATW
jgi:hypothetical protein